MPTVEEKGVTRTFTAYDAHVRILIFIKGIDIVCRGIGVDGARLGCPSDGESEGEREVAHGTARTGLVLWIP